jgi:5-methylcytosine-specific restriction enzyme subunit McrC
MTPAGAGGVVELSEWDEVFIPNAALTPSDRRIVGQLFPYRRLLFDELTTGLRIRAQSWVGLIRLENFDLRVVPKLADGNAKLVQMLAITGGIRAAWQNEAIRTVHAERVPDLLDLLSLLLIRESERILAGGVLHDYVEREEALGAVRGRFLADRQLLKRFGQFHLLECRFDEHDSDIDENRLLAFALGTCKTLLRDRFLIRRVLSLHEQFASICESEHLDTRHLRTSIVYHRLNSHYAGAHELCWLILEAMGIADLLTSGSVRSNVFLIDMNSLFERFVHKLIEFCLGTAYRVQYQMKMRSILWDADRDRPYSAVIRDFQLIGLEGNLIVDAKYKLGKKLDNADIYQCFLYAQAFGGATEAPSQSVLLVPSLTGSVEHSRLEVRDTQGARKSILHIVAFPVAAAVDEMQAGQLGPIATQLGSLLCQAAKGSTLLGNGV